ncbi:hypothetical protein B0H13DRAFT_2337522 [Mycena leptocephala]|nr:hypothetical protein B0H13DRAFT_2337522 [Mycena leptocephala]
MLATQLISALALVGMAFSHSIIRSSTNLTTCTPHPVSSAQQHEIFKALAKSWYTERNITQAFTHVAANEIQHNPFLPDGAVSTFNFVNALFQNPAVTVEVLHQAFAAPIGWVHYRMDGLYAEPTAIVDVFRFDGACVVEHWDIIEERPINATNPHALF